MTTTTSRPEFGRLRNLFWPVHRNELKRFLPMLFMAFLIGFAYNILRNVKDSLLVTAASSGAEVIPFVKVWALLPMAVLLTTIFIKLSHRYSTQTVFYSVISGFLSFFLLYSFVLYPLGDRLHLHSFADKLQATLPEGLMGLVAMVRYWSFSLFYTMCELWGVIVQAVLFWGLANEISRVCEAKRFYGLLGFGANLSSIFAGQISCMMSSRLYNPNWVIGVDRWHQSLILLTIVVVVSGVGAMIFFRWLNQRVLHLGQTPAIETNRKLKRLESRPSIRESISQLTKSKYLISLAAIVIAYNIFINLVEVLWKAEVRSLYPDPNAYSNYMGQVTTITGFIATGMALAVSGIIRKFGWRFTALLTPVMLMVTSIGFFGFYLTPDRFLGSFTVLLGVTPLGMVVFFGSLQNCFSRGFKYSVFDTSKELTYIPLKREERVRGKAAIDGVASRLGKSGGSLIYQTLLMFFGSLSRCAPIVGMLLIGVLSAWCVSVNRVAKQFRQLQNAPPEPEPTPTASFEPEIAEPQAV